VIDNTFKINCQNNAPATRKNATLHTQCTTHNAHLNTLTIFHCCCFISILNSSEKSSLCIAHYRIHYHFSMHQTMCLCSVMTENGLHSSSHTHIHPFNGPFNGTTQVSRYQKGKTNLDFTEAKDSEWQWHQLGHMQVCTSLQTDNHASTPPLSFYRPNALPAAQPTASKHWRQHSSCIHLVTDV